ncbi:hypothetical protein [Streptomyces otsuchiensis]|nr:hypothetical protein [Streptomyces otsuchiensis]
MAERTAEAREWGTSDADETQAGLGVVVDYSVPEPCVFIDQRQKDHDG